MTGKARILFVDDEKRVLNSMRGLFRRDYELYLATEGKEAVRIAAENEIDVIVADQRMPGMTGIEVLAKIKEQSPRTVRILLTGYADPSAVEGSINIGEVFRFLSKPCPPNMLRETLSLAIEAAQTKPVAATASAPPQPVQAAVPTPPQPVQTASPTPPQPIQAAAPTPPQPIQTASPAPQQPVRTAAPTPQQAPVAETAPEPAEIDSFAETHPSLPSLDESAVEHTGEHTSTHWQSVTNVVMSEDTVEETQGNVALTSSTLGINDVGVVVFTVDSEFASTAIRAVSTERTTVLATTLVKVAQAVAEQNAGVLVTDFTTNNTILQKIIGALKQRMPELVTIVVSSGRDTTDMINLINYGQVFRYVLKPVESEQLKSDINAAVMHHLYLINNPESMQRHQVVEAPKSGESSVTLNEFLGKIRQRRSARTDPTDTIS